MGKRYVLISFSRRKMAYLTDLVTRMSQQPVTSAITHVYIPSPLHNQVVGNFTEGNPTCFIYTAEW